jgi:serine/threonine protein kinase/dipeptidyl aminopeptidase/acylaminoacyl peptidase
MAESPNSRQQIEALYRSARKLDATDRRAFLDRVCAGDDSLRQEIETLLSADAKTAAGPDAPSHADQSKSQPDASALIGQTIAHYKILSFLGRGGMGQVYLAQDTRLGRKVALKLLPTSLTHDEERLRRFEREARSASALSHPNVCVIHEVGETSDNHPYIAMEHIDGVTLRHRFTSGPLRLSEAIDIARQAASALSAAHDAGVVHRDIKPENIMLRRDGYVKVLDFGLAKLTERYEAGSDSEAPTFHAFNTHSGLLIGTTNYLSPEQARRQEVDERTDIWSLGVVLYEMLAGRMPFTGETASHVIVAILETDPVPLTQFRPAVPAELEWIVKKALRKDSAQRYQTIKELLGDLEDVKQKLNQSGAERAGQLASSAQTPPVTRHSSAFESISQSLRRPRISIGVFALALFLLALIGWGAFHWLKAPTASFQNMVLTKLTNTGRSIHNGAALSPDGKYVAHVIDEAGRQSLVVSYQATASDVVVVPPAEVRYHGLTFSRDGDYVYYVRYEKSDLGLLYSVPVRGGAPKKITQGVDSAITFSPDGRKFAFVRFEKVKGEYSLVIAASDGTAEKILATRRSSDLFSIYGLDWSPDGKLVAALDGTYAGGFHMRVIGVNVEDGSETPISARQWFAVLQIKWLNDGSGLVLNAADESVSPIQIWYVSYPGGAATRVTNDANDYYGVSLSAKSSALVTVQSTRLINTWVAPTEDTSRVTRIASTSAVSRSYGLAWTPDNRLIYSSMGGGRLDLWSMKSDGSEKTQLTIDSGSNYHPSVSPDGRYIFFASSRTGSFNIWRMDHDGSDPRQLTGGGSDFYPYPSPDGKWVVYERGGGGKRAIWRVPVEGGKAEQLTDTNTSVPVVSPDGKVIACRYWDDNSNSQKIAIIPFAGGKPIRTFDIPIIDWQRIRWTIDGKALTYVQMHNGVSNIWQQPINGGPPKQLTYFQTDQIVSYDWSRDNKLVACERGVEANDVVLLTSYK